MKLAALLTLLLLAACAAPRETWHCTRVIDGDTLDVVHDGRTERVRMLCIDTPERGQAGFDEAREFLEGRVLGRELALEADAAMHDRDRYGRLLRYVWHEGRLVNAEVVRAGHSTYWTKYGRSSAHEAEFRR